MSSNAPFKEFSHTVVHPVLTQEQEKRRRLDQVPVTVRQMVKVDAQ
jgi:hypothetical protein